MKRLYYILRLPPGIGGRYVAAHHIWMALALTGLGTFVGAATLVFSVYIYEPMLEDWLLDSYQENPLFLALNCLAPILLIWLFYCISGRAWIAYLGCAIPVGAIAAANFYKVRLRTDPVWMSDLLLVFEAGDIAGGYDLTPSPHLLKYFLTLAGGLLFVLLLMPQGVRNWRVRLFGTAACLALMAVAIAGPYSSEELYKQANNNNRLNPWSPTELYLGKGCVYSFLYSKQDLIAAPPEGYRKAEIAKAWEEIPDSDIPADKRVSVMGFMLEAFCDMTDLPKLGEEESVQALYAPWHELEERSVSGNLLTNIFAGGTVDTEWAFDTGYTAHENFGLPANSYVWYFREQGYQTFGSHPGQRWFYNRQNVNRNLGFQEYRFQETYFNAYFTLEEGVRNSDLFLASADLEQLTERLQNGPCFSFSVTYQNHGPYGSEAPEGTVYLTPEGCGLSQESCTILNNYFDGLSRTIAAFTGLAEELEEMEEPVVLVLFGDHKPWSGNNGSVYSELGVNFDTSTLEGFENYYSTPYLIWANSSAKAVLGNDFTGDGGTFSGCFLMPKLFDLCGWEGPGFMKLSRQLRDITPLVHATGRFLVNGALTDTLPQEDQAFYQRFLQMQYYQEREVK